MYRLIAVAAVCLLAMPSGGAETAPANNPMPHPTIDQAALDKLGWKLGCQAWTFRKLSLFETLDTLNGLGVHYIEIYPGQRLSPE